MKTIWCDIRGEKNFNFKIENKGQSDICIYIVSYKQFIENINRKDKFAVVINRKEELDKVDGENLAIIKEDNIELVTIAKKKNVKFAHEYSVTDKKTMIKAAESNANYIFVKLKDITNIPLELILAKSQKRNSNVIKYVDTYDEAQTALGTMEVGVNGVIVSPDLLKEVIPIIYKLNHRRTIALKECEVVEIVHLGLGTRMCIDTIDILEKNEGCIVGSTINGGLLVSSETHYLPYMNLRPFRVNAGGIHSYVMSDIETTMYMSEIECGSKVLVVNTEGGIRDVVVGRAKIEKRPLVKVMVSVEGMHINSILQDDWHIRIFDSVGTPVSIMDLKKGDKVLGYSNPHARHVGMPIEEQIIER